MRKVGNADETLRAFLRGVEFRTPSAPVPGGCRVSSAPTEGTNDYGETLMALYSYRTVVATRNSLNAVAVTTRRYSVTTSKLMGHLRTMLYGLGYVPTGEFITVRAAVPGRWGGFGPAWHATGWELLPFEVWARTR